MKTSFTYRFTAMKNRCLNLFIFLCTSVLLAQNSKLEKQANTYMAEASSYIESNDFAAAEASMRKAISVNPENKKAAYNFGNLYITNEKNRAAFQRLVEAVTETEDKEIKHKSFHNQGNVFMSEERYAEAVEAYKNALRNNPNDDETRYNLALAKKKMEEQGGDGGDGDDQENQKEQENQDQGEGENEDENKGENEESDQKDAQEGDNKDEKNQGEGENKPEEKGEKEEKEKEQPSEGKSPQEGQEGDKQAPPPQQMQGKISPEQLKNLLEAIENQEKDIQDKLNAKELKGKKVKNEKDW